MKREPAGALKLPVAAPARTPRLRVQERRRDLGRGGGEVSGLRVFRSGSGGRCATMDPGPRAIVEAAVTAEASQSRFRHGGPAAIVTVAATLIGLLVIGVLGSFATVQAATRSNRCRKAELGVQACGYRRGGRRVTRAQVSIGARTRPTCRAPASPGGSSACAYGRASGRDDGRPAPGCQARGRTR